MKKGSEVLWTMVVVVVVLLSSCNSSKPAQKNIRITGIKPLNSIRRSVKLERIFRQYRDITIKILCLGQGNNICKYS